MYTFNEYMGIYMYYTHSVSYGSLNLVKADEAEKFFVMHVFEILYIKIYVTLPNILRMSPST